MAAKDRRPTSKDKKIGSTEGFTDPADETPVEQDSDENSEEFAPPSPADLGAASAESESAAVELGVDEDIAALKGELEDKLSKDANATAAGEVFAHDIEGANIVGVGFGYSDGADVEGADDNLAPPGETGLVVFTVDRVETTQIVSEIAEVAGTRALSTLPIIQVPVGVVEAYSHRFRIRPAPGGVSVGHYKITAGTLGCLCVGLHAPRTNRLMILSNNHVIANSNNAALGDCICQPGPYDGGKCPQDQIAILERFVPIKFGGPINYVDCATGWAWPDRVRRELVYLSGGSLHYFRIGSASIDLPVGALVGKTGRTTQLKQGRITARNVSVNVNYGGGRIAHFRDQFSIVGTTSAGFSAGGDSGSVVWHWAAGLRPAGLLFAGGGGTTFANRMHRVEPALDIRLYT